MFPTHVQRSLNCEAQSDRPCGTQSVTTAFCSSRTVIKNDNTYLKQITPMAQRSAAVRHAMLVVASSYVLDYRTYDELRVRANYHYQRAVTLVGEELRKPWNRTPGAGEALLAALILLYHTQVSSEFILSPGRFTCVLHIHVPLSPILMLRLPREDCQLGSTSSR